MCLSLTHDFIGKCRSTNTEKGTITDDAMLVEKYTDVKVKMAMGSYNNIKITTPEDMGMALQIIKGQCG